MKDHEQIYNCLLCGGKFSPSFRVVFGDTPLANELSEYGDYLKEDLFRLVLVQCEECNHIQLDEIIDGSRLFRDYLYVAGTSEVNRKHFQNYAESVSKEYLKEGDLVIDIGSNDGLLLSYFKNLGMKILGVDPAKNIVKEANKKDLRTIPEFFTYELAEKLISNMSKSGTAVSFKLAKVITCNNMFAHTKDLKDVVRGVLELLDDNGVFIFENSYLGDILDKSLYDTIYHEHCHTHAITPLIKFFRKFGMKIFDIEPLPNQQGGSLRVFVCRNSNNR